MRIHYEVRGRGAARALADTKRVAEQAQGARSLVVEDSDHLTVFMRSRRVLDAVGPFLEGS